MNYNFGPQRKQKYAGFMVLVFTGIFLYAVIKRQSTIIKEFEENPLNGRGSMPISVEPDLNYSKDNSVSSPNGSSRLLFLTDAVIKLPR